MDILGRRRSQQPACAMKSALVLLLITNLVSGFEVVINPSAEVVSDWKAGRNSIASCEVVGTTEGISIEWISPDGTVIGHNSRIRTLRNGESRLSLMFAMPTKEDSGKYICRVTSNGETNEDYRDVKFFTPAKFVDMQPIQHPLEGGDADITCRVQSDEEKGVSMIWQRQGVVINEGEARGYTFKEQRQVLVIPAFDSANDDGNYTCSFLSESNFEEQRIKVEAYSKPVLTVVPDATVQGTEGKSVTLSCRATGKPEPEFFWYKGVSTDTSPDRLNPTDKYALLPNGDLTINALIPDDAGDYTCVARNEVDEARNHTALNVFEKPRIVAIPNKIATQGESITFECQYTGDGEVTVQWLFSGEIIRPVPPTEGSLTGAAHNVIEDGTDRTEYQEYKGGDGIEDEHYDHEDDDMDSMNTGRYRRQDSSSRRTVTAEKGVLRLTVSSVLDTDAGEYQCEASNEAGTVKSPVKLQITHEPRMVAYTDEVVRAVDTARVSFFCEVDAVPAPDFQWLAPDGSKMYGDADKVFIETSEDKLKSTVKLRTEGPGDYGVYKCRADNKVGDIAEQTINVIKIERPPKVINLSFDANHPNYAMIVLSYDGIVQASNQPEHVIFRKATVGQTLEDDFDWEYAESIELKYATGDSDKQQYRIDRLVPDTEYSFVAITENMAGTSDMSDPWDYRTSGPMAPAAPVFVQEAGDSMSECDSVCTVNWLEPNNHGAEITNFRLTATPVQLPDPLETGSADFQPIGDTIIYESISVEQREMTLNRLEPNTFYQLKLVASNGVGNSEPGQMIIKTSDYVAPGLSNGAIFAIVFFLLLAILVVIDVSCYILARCGVLACICVNCLGRNIYDNKNKEISMEEGARPESAQLLKQNEPPASTEINGTNGHTNSHKATTV